MIDKMIHNSAQAFAVASSAAIQRRATTTANTTSASATATEETPAQQPGAQYDFASIFGAASDQRNPTPGSEPATAHATAAAAPATLKSNIAAATATVTHHSGITPGSHNLGTMAVERASVSTAASGLSADVATARAANATAAANAATAAVAAASTPTTVVTAATPSAASTTEDTGTTAVTVANPGIMTLVNAIMSGSVNATYQSDRSKLAETSPGGNASMPDFYFASDQTAAQMAQLLGGTVVQMHPFGQDAGWNEPNANFIKLPNGQAVNAADLAYYGRCGNEGVNQLVADITQTINQGAAWNSYFQNGGSMPSFAMGQVGPPISGMTYPPGTIGADGNVINPAMQKTVT